MRFFRGNKIRAGRTEVHYPPEAVQYIKDHTLPIAPEDWKTSRGTADGSSDVLAQRLFDEYVEKHGPQHVRNYRSRALKNNKLIGGQINQHYSPEAVAHVKEHLSKIPPIAPDDWVTRGALARELQRGPEIVQQTLDDFVAEHGSEHAREFRLKRERAGKVLLGTVEPHYSLDAAAYVRERLSAVPEAPDQWKTLSALVDELKYGPKLIGPLLTEYIKQHGTEHSKSYRKKKIRDGKVVFGEAVTHYSPAAAAFVKEGLSDISIVPEGWKTIGAMADEENETEPRVAAYLNEFVEKNGVAHRRKFQASIQRQDRTVAGRIQTYYSPEAIAYAKDQIKTIPIAPDNWLSIIAATKQTGLSYGTAQSMLDKYVADHGEHNRRELRIRRTRKGEVVGGEVLQHYSPEAIATLRSELANVPVAPDGWKTINGLSELGSAKRVESFLKEFVDKNGPQHTRQYRASAPHEGGVRKGKVLLHYSPQAVEYATTKLTEIPFAPTDWKTSGAITVENGQTGHEGVRAMLDRFVAEHGSQHMREYRTLRARGDKEVGGPVFDHFSPQAAEFIRDYYARRDIEKTKTRDVNEKFSSFFENFVDLKEFQVLIGLFGSAQVIDVLYALRPEFKNIPLEQVKGMIAEYLGSYLLSPLPFEVDNLEKALVHLKNDSLRGGLREVIKSDCLHVALKVKKLNPTVSERDLFANYFVDLRKRCGRYRSPELQNTISEVEEYYYSVFEDFAKPGHRMVEELKEGRKFPDLYQRINVKEISDKKRMLIADEMGTGKSASAILAKEELGVKTALIVAPSNVISTWKEYLSDTVAADGKQIGYFRPGLQPRVLTIDDPADIPKLQGEDIFDYILISQEKLNRQGYIDPLLSSGFDMLVVDEIHEMKNVREGKRSEALLQLADSIKTENQYLALLSGTPVPNKIEDVAVLLKLLHPERFEAVSAKQMIPSIISGNLADLRTLLVPRMQMKSLAENVDMPKLTEETITFPLTKAEEEIYQVLLDEDELSSVEKMHALRQFLVNPALLDIAPDTQSSKLELLKSQISESFRNHNKVLVFVNDYISDVIRGENSILEGLDLPDEVDVHTIHGGTSDAQRQSTQRSLNKGNRRMLLFVSGSTAAVGVDYSGADRLIFYNEPWTRAEKDQQRSRTYRPGLEHDIEATTLLAENTIDEGIHRYIEAKHNVIAKLLRGIPVTEFEQELISKAEKSDDPNLEVNAELAKYYFSVFDKMNRIFGSVKQIGEKRFQEFLEKRGDDYADYYVALGGRSYQANAGRVCAALIQNISEEKRIARPRILDMGSGPEMLRKHSPERFQADIVSADLNPAHFTNPDRGMAVVASYTKAPFADETFDFVNMSLVLHHTKFIPSKNDFERVKALAEMARVLKTGGHGIINEMYSLDLKDPSKLSELMQPLGLRVVQEYTGDAKAGDTYMSRVITLEKIGPSHSDPEEIIKKMPREMHDGLKFREPKDVLKNRRRIISEFAIGSKKINIPLNTRDRMLQEQEQKILSDAEALKRQYGSIESIPKEMLTEQRFHRFRAGRRYALFKLSDGSAIVVK